ncbi:MAG: 3-hydroxyisobutyrate dehydrogenase [Gammaproteobacteria bacterium]|uniref:3-hydroxyisobutyrate dehydrogenase n=1 Tax=OM182 bacterium MED-G24 TaxID=1986255 RepID=A0A2A5WNN3_9GAMM|nr:3-hydroxyisobutyrate dehydrogenase [Gammaproteobacteria bacterium]PDH37868.1 MAG: 3-hydroxyisobutyrate dehydrogenase [OM182 bacterium MED-G24]|tara:strand:- start:623 stop:1516 length:894 start_codon:yes stop_codon:yes gene_type:complete
MARIGFLGLGNMGQPMASNLLKAGHKLTVFDLVVEQCAPLADQGATIADNASSAIENVDVVISMLPASEDVSLLYLGENGDGLLDQLSTYTLVIDCSTIAAETAREVAAAANDRGITMLDAPVSGGVGGAVAGTLTFIVGGRESGFDAAKPILKDMGKNIFHAGDAGAGQVAKICNNMLLAITMTGTAEALQMGVDNGLDPRVLSDVISASSGGNWAVSTYNPYPGVMENVPAANDYARGFLVRLMIKDLDLALGMADQSTSYTPLGKLARRQYEQLRERGADDLDFSSIQSLYRTE